MANRKNITTSLDSELKDTFTKIAKIEGRKLNYYLDKGLRAILKEHINSLKEYENKDKNV